MELEAFRVSGLRCLADIDWIPVARPTILTGANDGGKTTALLALSFLLTGKGVLDSDFTATTDDEPDLSPMVATSRGECFVEGRFRLSADERERLSLPEEVTLRRHQELGVASPSLRVLTMTPEDHRLRGIEARSLADLRTLAADIGVVADGPANHRESYLRPLRTLASDGPLVEDWVAPAVLRELTDCMPRLVLFASTAEPDPESDIRKALQEAYSRALEDATIVGPVREAEHQVREQLENEATALRDHIIERCPELQNLLIEPSVSFREGFAGVRLFSARGDGGQPIPLEASGAGMRRRINLATWEWTRLLIGAEDSNSQTVVLAYDEPDTHLDYRHQRDLADLVRAQCEEEGVRVVLATHSLNLIDKISIEDVVHLELVEGRTTVTRLFHSGHEEVDQHLKAIAVSMGLRNSVLLHERCFVGVEGVTEQQAIPLLFRTATGLSLQAAGIALVPAGGNTGAWGYPSDQTKLRA